MLIVYFWFIGNKKAWKFCGDIASDVVLSYNPLKLTSQLKKAREE